MAKITSRASLVLGTNLKLHVADKSGTDIAITKSGSTLTITNSVMDFTAAPEVSGVVNRALIVGDSITLGHCANALNEGVVATLTAVAAHSLTATITSGTGATEAAGNNINIVAFKKTWQYLAAGGLSFVDGVDGIVLVSKFADMWDVTDLDRYDPAFTSIEPRAKSIAALNGWEPHDANTLNANRGTALEVRPSKTASATKIYALLRSTSNADATTDQLTFWYSGDAELTAPSAFVMAGYADQNVLILDTQNAVDKRGLWYTRLAVQGKTIVMESHNLQYAEIYPISAANAPDPKLTVPDATIAAGGVYAGVTFNLDVDSVYSGDVNGTSYNFTGYVEANSQTNEVVHQKLNYLWRQAGNINTDGTGPVKRGDKQWPLTKFSGESFTVQSYLLHYKASQRNNLTVVDAAGNARTWPSAFTITRTAPDLAVGGTGSIIHKDTHGTSNPVYLKNDAGTDLKDVPILATEDFVVAYSTYNNNGHTPGTPIPLVATWNRPGHIEPDNVDFILGAANITVPVTAAVDPSYTSA